MGFVDVIGISVSYAKEQFGWSEIRAGLLPFMVFSGFSAFGTRGFAYESFRT